MEELFAVRLGLEARGAVWHHAFALGGADFAAEIRFTGFAEFAFAAFGGAGGGQAGVSFWLFCRREKGGW